MKGGAKKIKEGEEERGIEITLQCEDSGEFYKEGFAALPR